MNNTPGIPPKQGLYDPANERDACGIGFIVNVKGVRSHDIVHQALEILVHLEHRGACGCEPNTGDGAGILMQVPHRPVETGHPRNAWFSGRRGQRPKTRTERVSAKGTRLTRAPGPRLPQG